MDYFSYAYANGCKAVAVTDKARIQDSSRLAFVARKLRGGGDL